MEAVVLICRYVLAVVFVVSGASKLTDRAGTREAVQSFGVPRRAVSVVALLLAPVELGVATLLVPGATGRVGAAVALCLLGALTAAVLANLAVGRRPSCHCFGRIGSSDISSRTVVRNLGLAGLAAVGAWSSSGPHEVIQVHGWGGLAAAVISALLIAGVLLAAEAGMGRRAALRRTAEEDRRLQATLDGDGELGPAPTFRLATAAGEDVSLADLLDGRRSLLLTFLSPGCGPCKRLRPAAARWGDVFADRLRVAVLASGTTEANRKAFATSPLTVLLDQDAQVAAAFGVTDRPSAVLISPDGRLLTPVARGEVAVRRLLVVAVTGNLPGLDAADTPPEAPAESLTLDAAPAPRPTATLHREHDGPGSVVTDEGSGSSAGLDTLGTLVWQCLDGESRIDDIARDLADAFGAPQELVADDVLRLIQDLGRRGLLAGIAATPVASSASPRHEHAPEPLPA